MSFFLYKKSHPPHYLTKKIKACTTGPDIAGPHAGPLGMGQARGLVWLYPSLFFS